MEKERNFKKVDRSYHSTPNGWRLATFEEAKNGLEGIKKQQLLSKWDRARLLDGWISGHGYDYEIGNEFRDCMGYMLLIEAQTSAENASGGPYANVNLSEFGKEVALLLCVDDWNYEVVYWLLNSLSKSQTMNLRDVRGGHVPFTNAAKFQEMNRAIVSLALRLGDEQVAAREKARMTKYSGTDSVKDILKSMIQIVRDLVTGSDTQIFSCYGGEDYFLPESLRTGDATDAFWSFVCDTFAGHLLKIRANDGLKSIHLMNTKKKSKKNLMTATSILLYLSGYRSYIIHEPIPHRCRGICAGMFLSYAVDKAAGNPHRFCEMLKHNAMWRCYDKTGNYGILNKVLFLAAKGEYANHGKMEFVVEMLLKCGAQPAGCYAIGKHQKKTALHNAAKFHDKDVSTAVAQAMLGSCDEESRYQFVNAADERGRTALHRASQNGNVILCQLLVEFNASVNAQDQESMTPLHYAFYGEGINDDIINVFMKSPQVANSVDLKDKRGNTPLDIAIAMKDYASTAKLLSMSKKPEAYFSKVDQEQLLRYSLLVGSAKIFQKLYEKDIKLPAGYRDEDGKPALHLAANLDDEDSAIQIIKTILPSVRLETLGQDRNTVAECDRGGRTVLHEAAMNGRQRLCEHLLEKNPKLINIKDRDGRNPLYDAVKGKCKDASLSMQLLNAVKDVPVEDLVDRSGLTPLHVAVSLGKVELVKALLSSDRFKAKYLRRGDFSAQTALHKAVKRGDIDTVEILLNHGAHPLRERDCDGRTALHYAVQAETGDREKLAEALFTRCESEQDKSLLLWASAAGLGTADQNLRDNDPLHKVLLQKKNETKEINLLRTAASAGDIEMTKELIIRGYPIGDIIDKDWRKELDQGRQDNVTRVSKQIEMIKEQGNDKPAISDSLGRLDYAQGLAALFLNPYIKPPIAVGITGTWGMGKSSLMFQTEQILLTTAAQMALLESSKLRSSALELPGIKSYKLSSKGRRKCENIYKQIKYGERINRNLNMTKIQEELEEFLNKYDPRYRKVFKLLAAMDSSDMFETDALRPKADPSTEENLPAVLTVQYNAWKYRNDTEALAGMAVEITKELEGAMSQAQWLSTCCRNAWRKKKYTLWIEIFFPSLLALVLVSSLTWIAWVVFDSDKFKELVKAKYAWPPAAIVIIVWTLTKSVMGILKPVSTQLMQYISFPDHSDKLGYQERVISDVTFLKDEIGKKAYWVFIVFGWVFTTFTELWRLITELWVTSLLFHHRRLEKAIDAPKVPPASGSNLRIIVFVDDLDRCQESVILQVLSAINIVLAECEINVVMGMDKRLIQRAIMKKYGDGKANRSLKTTQELADMYLQKIIQLPLDLPDPSEEQSRRFLKGQLGVLENGDKAPDNGDEKSPRDEESDDGASSRGDGASSRGEGEAEAEQNAAAPEHGDDELDDGVSSHGDGASSNGDGEAEAEQQNAPTQVSINMPSVSEKAETGPTNLPELKEPTDDRSSSRASEKKCLKLLKYPLQALWKAKTETGQKLSESQLNIDLRSLLTNEPTETGRQAPSQAEEDKLPRKLSSVQQNPSSSILMREMLFVRYSQGEENAFFYFQGLATDYRKLPREWKRLLNYHRLVWYIFSLSKEAKNLVGWQIQLITWIFVCWEWQENMNLVIEKWKEISYLKTSESNEPPSLLMIVEHLMEEHAEDIENMQKATSQKLVKDNNKLDALEKSLAELKEEMRKLKEQVCDELKEKMKELIKQVSDELKEEMTELKKQASNELKEEMKELRKEFDELNEEMKELKKQVSNELKEEMKELKKEFDELNEEMKGLKNQMSHELEEEMKEWKKQVFNELKEEMKELKKKSDELKEEIKEMIKQVSDELKGEMKGLKKQMSGELKEEIKELKKDSDEFKEEMKELKKHMSDELKKDTHEIREQMVKKQNVNNEQNMENKKYKLHNLENWKRMKSTLERYNVPMDGIQAFQRFRFYCIAGYLPRPSLKE